VYTPTLSGLGERSHQFDRSINLTTHVADIANLVRWEGLERIVLVGHSYGGMVVTGVADRIASKISCLIYLDAFLPGEDQSLCDLIPAPRAQALIDSDADNGHRGIPPVSAELFNVNNADRAWVDALCTPQPLATFTEPLSISANVDSIRSKCYALATGNTLGGGFHRFRDSIAASPGWTTRELPCGHDVMIDLPDETASFLDEAGQAGA
jgi:pimeloyl-ACP methyl ester carboxylesterase